MQEVNVLAGAGKVKFQSTLWKKDINFYSKQDHKLKNWVEGLSDEAYFPLESPKRNWLKSVNHTIEFIQQIADALEKVCN